MIPPLLIIRVPIIVVGETGACVTTQLMDSVKTGRKRLTAPMI